MAVSGNNKAVKIPKEDRGKIDARRLPAVVVKIKHTTPPMYKLACKFGTIEGYFSTSNIVSYPGVVDIGNEDCQITLREAARENSVLKKDIYQCKCKKKCDNNRCPCKKHKVMCHTRCHAGTSCKNKCSSSVENIKRDALPAYGGTFGGIFFSNTCPLDNWLAMLSVIEKHKLDELIKSTCDINPQFSQLLCYIKMSDFMQAKFYLAELNALQCKNKTFNFFGYESMFTTYMNFMVEYEMMSVSSSDHCEQKQIPQLISTIPSVSIEDCSSVVSFKAAVLNWLIGGTWLAHCIRRLTEPLPPAEFIYWDKDMLT